MKPGAKPKGKVKILWSPKFAYAIGLLVADGCLSKDGRHMDFTSVDKDLVELFEQCLGVHTKISRKLSGAGNLSHHTQFGDVLFYKFLLSIGITPAKSKTISNLKIPPAYFRDFLRGYFDGDGSSYSYMDQTFKKSFRLYISFTSASPAFLDWLQEQIRIHIGVSGYISKNKNTTYVQLKYAKKATVQISQAMYYDKDVPRLKRKYVKLQRALRKV
jgi:hypothetical protein